MRLVFLLAWRHVIFRPGKTLASALGIGVGIATVVSVLTVDHNTMLSQAARRGLSDPETDLLISPLQRSVDVFDDVAEDLRSRTFLRGVTAYATRPLSLAVGGRVRASIELMAVEEGAASFHAGYDVQQGEALDHESAEPQLLISAFMADKHELEVGSLVELTRPPRRRAAVARCVDGEIVMQAPRPTRAGEPEPLHPFRVTGILSPTRLGYPKMRALTTFARGREVMGNDMRAHFWADFDKSQLDLQGVENRLRDAFVVKAPKRALSGEAPEERAFRSGVRFCGFLALFLGLYIIFNTMSMSLVERVRQIGLLRALGVTRGRLAAIFLVEGLILSLLGAVLAVVLAERIVSLMQRWQITTLGFGKPLDIIEVPWGQVAAVMVAGVLFSLAGILYPFLRAARLSVIDALRRGVIELAHDPFTGTRRLVLLGILALVPVAWFVGLPSESSIPVPLWEAILLGIGIVAGVFAVLLLASSLLPNLAARIIGVFKGPAMLLARSTVLTARHRVFATVTGLMLVFAAVFLVISVLESLKSETRQFAERALAGRLYLKTTPEGAEQIAALREVKGLPELATLVPINVEVRSQFLVRAIDARMLNSGSLAGDNVIRRLFERQPTVILSTRCAADFGYEVDELVTLPVDSEEGAVDFRVLAISDEYGFKPDDRVFAAVSAASMKRYWCLDSEGLGDYFMAWAPGMSAPRLEALRGAAEDVLGEGQVLDLRRGDDIADDYLADLDKDFGIFYAILVLTVMLAAIGVLNAMVIAVMERRREIGLLRAVGLTGSQVARMLLVESGAFGVLGGLLGLVVGIPLAALTAGALTESSHLSLAFVMSPAAAAMVMGGAVVVALLAVVFPALRANSLRLSTVVRYE